MFSASEVFKGPTSEAEGQSFNPCPRVPDGDREAQITALTALGGWFLVQVYGLSVFPRKFSSWIM